MRRITRSVGRLILITAFILSAIATGLMASGMDTLLEEGTYQRLVQESNIAEAGRGLVVQALVGHSVGSGAGGDVLAQYPPETWVDVAEEIIPVDWTADTLLSVTTTFIDWVQEPDSSLPEITLDIAFIQRTLITERGTRAILPLLQQAPTCPRGTTQVHLLTNEGLISCLPEGSDVTQYSDILAQAMAQSIPQELALVSLLEDQGSNTSSPQQLFRRLPQYVDIMRATKRLTSILGLLTLSLIALIDAGSPRRALRAIRTPLYLAGGISVLLSLTIWAAVRPVINSAVRYLLPINDLNIRLLLVESTTILGRILAQNWLVISGIVLGVGFLTHLVPISWDFISAKLSNEVEEPELPKRAVRREFR